VSYRVARGEAAAELRVSASRFFAHVGAAADAAAAQEFLAAVRRRYPDATHHCFAWRLGWPPTERAADAGEPAGTAGTPILVALRAPELTDVVAVVARYFGGTKLGKGGLARAYRDAVRQALAGLATETARARARFALRFPPARAGAVRRLLRPGAVELVAERWGAAVEAELAVDLERRAEVAAALAELGIEMREL
jgi:uncharacterized YigZ family protein